MKLIGSVHDFVVVSPALGVVVCNIGGSECFFPRGVAFVFVRFHDLEIGKFCDLDQLAEPPIDCPNIASSRFDVVSWRGIQDIMLFTKNIDRHQ